MGLSLSNSSSIGSSLGHFASTVVGVAGSSGRMCTLTPDQSCCKIVQKLHLKEPFFFVRYGDGAIEAIFGIGGHQTCDGEKYSRELAIELASAWDAVVEHPATLVGDWRTASFEADTHRTLYAAEYNELICGAAATFLHFEALLMMRRSIALAQFYRVVKEYRGRKVLMAPECMRGAAASLGARHVITPMADLFARRAGIERDLMREEFDLLLYGAGMAGNIPAVNCWKQFPERTYINIGSSLDPLYRGKTRRQQLSQAEARRLFSGVFI